MDQYRIPTRWMSRNSAIKSSCYRDVSANILKHIALIWLGGYIRSGIAILSPPVLVYLRQQWSIPQMLLENVLQPQPGRVIHFALRNLLWRFRNEHICSSPRTDFDGDEILDGSALRSDTYYQFFPPKGLNCLQRWMWAVRIGHTMLDKPEMRPPIEPTEFSMQLSEYYASDRLKCNCISATISPIYHVYNYTESVERWRALRRNDEYKRLYSVGIMNDLCDLRVKHERLTHMQSYAKTALPITREVGLSSNDSVVASCLVAILQYDDEPRRVGKKPKPRKQHKPPPRRGRWFP